MPRLWTDTIEAHRRSVQDAIVETTAALVGEHGLAAVTMSQIAEETGIGRATLYKYFPDVEAILVAWHDRHVSRHLARLIEIRDGQADAGEPLTAVLEAYASISQERARGHAEGEPTRERSQRSHSHSPEHPHPPFAMDLAAYVHRDKHAAHAERRLRDFLRDLLIDAARSGDVRDDVPADELADYCLHALGGAGTPRTKPAVERLVAVTLAGLRPPPRSG